MARHSFAAFDAPSPSRSREVASGTSTPHRSAASIRHSSIIDFMLMHPEKRMTEVAQHFGLSLSYLSTIRHSDNFARELETRRARIVEAVEQTTVARIRDLANTSLDTMKRRIQSDPNLPLGEVRESCQMALNALGYSRSSSSAEQQQGAQITINIGKEDLALARSRIGSRNLDDEAIEITPVAAE